MLKKIMALGLLMMGLELVASEQSRQEQVFTDDDLKKIENRSFTVVRQQVLSHGSMEREYSDGSIEIIDPTGWSFRDMHPHQESGIVIAGFPSGIEIVMKKPPLPS